MFEILTNMIKEEWRIHSRMFGGLNFFLFPFLILLFTLLICFFTSNAKLFSDTTQIPVFVHYAFLMFGLSIGAFGLLGREVMNRRFGQASMIAYSSRTLPISERTILFNFFIKDIIYYFLLWILPIVVGFSGAMSIISLSPIFSATLLLTLTLSFLIGLSIAFFLSTIYVHSMKILIGVLIFSAAAIFVASLSSLNPTNLLPPLSFFINPSVYDIILSIAIIAALSTFSIVFLKIDYPEKRKRYKSALQSLAKRLRFLGYPLFVSKDFLDLNRSEGGIGKILFSFLIPLGILWLLISIFMKILPVVNPLMMFAIFLGVISSSIYNWLTEYDIFPTYSFLPIKVSTIIKSKINSYIILNLLSVIILVLLSSTHMEYFLPALFAFIGVSCYSLGMLIYLTGLYPNILLYNARIFLVYTISLMPVLLVMIFLSIFSQLYLLLSPLLILVSIYFIRKSFRKWDNWEQPSF